MNSEAGTNTSRCSGNGPALIPRIVARRYLGWFRITFRSKGKRQLVPRDHVSPILVFYCLLYLRRNKSFRGGYLQVSAIIILDGFYLPSLSLRKLQLASEVYLLP